MRVLLVLFSFMLAVGSMGGIHTYAGEGNHQIKGNLVIVGGALGSSNRDVYKEFIKLAGGKKQAKIGIIPAASGSLKSSNQFKQDLIRYGVSESAIEILPISSHDFSGTELNENQWKGNVNKKSVAENIKGLTGIWFVGGDQLRITDALLKGNGERTRALEAIWEIYKNGAVLGGTSAGAAIMSEVMITVGDSLGGLRQEFTDRDDADPSMEYAPVYIEQGLGFFQGGIVDQHFNERSRLGRLSAAAFNYGVEGELAYGIDEDTAMVVNNMEQEVRILGRSGVAVVDVQGATLSGGEMKNVDVSYLTPGDTLNFLTKDIKVSTDKLETKGYEYYDFNPLPATGVLTSYGTLQHYLSYSLVDNSRADRVQSYLYDDEGSGFRLSFYKAQDTNGYWGYQDGQKDSYSFVHVKMDATPVNLSFEEDRSLSGEYKDSAFTYHKQSFNKETKGSLVIVGGALGSSNEEVYHAFIERAGEEGKIGIIPAASSSLKSSHAFKSDLMSYGVNEGNISILPLANRDYKDSDEDESQWLQNKNDDGFADELLEYDAIWFVGGDQTRITDTLLNEDGTRSKALESIWKIYERGAVLGGTSAGAAIMSDVMLAGGGSHDALLKGFTEEYDSMTQQEGGALYLQQGLGFFPYGIIDQHFDKKARVGRLITTAAAHGKAGEYSYGIDEDTALIFDNATDSLTIKGKGGVSIVDLSDSEQVEDAPSEYRDIKLSWLTSGDSLNLETNEFNISDHKVPTTGAEYYEYEALPHSGVLTPHGSFGHFISYSLVDNALEDSVKSYSFNEGKGFELTFRKGNETNGYWGYKDGNKDDYSFTDVEMDIIPVSVQEQ
ncbi:cyanophycinase [Rossellomorea aquimaris]|uniref:cyanophycinase n=1 Tax=Rossellomorea aquimaris TaxID=189382 RepID=UPI001CD63C48|nr:cyanophycinase [Rossellomorea aquimaris]MCA1057049.1 cyanophycinase [Rossellomorea aquimaris]